MLKRFFSIALLVGLLSVSSASAEDVLPRLARLYPQLNASELREKIRVTRSPFEFYRSFVALFYDEIALHPPLSGKRALIRDDQGLCIGDAHPENFGVVFNDRSESVFTINDADDASPGPIYVDLLRFLAGVALYSPTTPLEPLVQTYLDALQGRMPPPGTLVAAAISKSQTKGASIPRKELRSDSELKRATDAIELSVQERSEIAAALSPIGLTLVDAYRYKRLKGGSFGTWRIPTLVDTAPGSAWGGKRILVELKQLFPSSLRALSPLVSIPDASVRIPEALVLFQRPYSVSQILRVTPLFGSTFLLRPRWSGNVDVELEDLASSSSAAEMTALYQNEAAVIGRIHREGARDLGLYLHHALQLDPTEWTNSARALADFIRATYQSVRTP